MIALMKRTAYILWIVGSLFIAWIWFFHSDWIVVPPKLNAQALDWDKNTDPPDPKRPYFDGCGNEYDYKGNLIHRVSDCSAPQPTIKPIQMPQVESFTGK